MIRAYFDGACAPFNPSGHMGIGCFIEDHDGTRIFEYFGYVDKNPKNSNNVAEYMAIENCIDFIIENGYQEDEITFYGDSKLVIMQMNKKWRIKEGRYVHVAQRCFNKSKSIKNSYFKWIPRELNSEADRLSNIELLKRGIKFNKF